MLAGVESREIESILQSWSRKRKLEIGRDHVLTYAPRDILPLAGCTS